MKGLRFSKIAKEIKFEGIWGQLEAKIFDTNSSFDMK